MNSRIEFYIREFRDNLLTPLFEDIRRTLEVTCYFSGQNNHGSNFIGNTAVLIGFETVAQFINPNTASEIDKFSKVAKQKHKSLNKNLKKYLQPRYAPKSGAELVRTFMKKFFDKRFLQKEFNTPAIFQS